MKLTLFARHVVALLACCSFAAAAAASAGPDADATYAAIAHRYFRENFAMQPSAATGLGVHDFDRKLDSFAASDIEKQLAADRRYLKELAGVDPASLSAEVALDRQLLTNALQDDLLLTGTIARWRHDPDVYVSLASGAVYGLFERAYAPLAVRMANATAREESIPRLFSQAKANLTDVPAEYAQIAYADARDNDSFFAATVPEAFASVKDPALRARFRRANAAARAALRDFAGWIKRVPLAHPSGTFAIGAAAYSARLKYEEALDVPLERYLKIGEDALADAKNQFVATAKKIDPAKSPQDVQASLNRVHPTEAGLLAAAQNDLSALRAFVIEHNLVSVPTDANIKVIPTPQFARQTTFASMDAPGPLEKIATQAFYNVTPVDPKLSAASREEFLGFFNDFSRPIISAHEVYPGHYLNFTIDKHLPLSETRRILGSASFAEGWAHYGEALIVDEGWGNGDPRVRLAQLRGALVRECRFIVGVKEHTQGMTIAEATQFFMDDAFMARGPAHREALRGTQDATYGYYTLGKLEILKLRKDMQAKLGPSFSLQKFHDALLAHGDPPIPLLRPLLLGSADDGEVL